ncbi:hypothetical protein BGW42_004524 [Actinomortierella wolfii]|nr:hypothetical protein BGW41_003999 [Actinomortierella wolfii]KAG0235878.1 hypothetical protein BGW42_004524 [Actinomortierella wolfii]
MSTYEAYPTTPRVNSAMLGNYKDKNVRFVGKIINHNAERAVMLAADKGQVQIHMNSESAYGTPYIEMIGKVNEDLSISEIASYNLGDNFDLDTYNAMIVKAQQFPDIF